jgi:hypothetical protein
MKRDLLDEGDEHSFEPLSSILPNVLSDIFSAARSTSDIPNERLLAHVEGRRQQRALDRRIDEGFDPEISLMLDRLNTMALSTSE